MNLPTPSKPTSRVIARLDIKAPNLVKGIHLEGLRVRQSSVEVPRAATHSAVRGVGLCIVLNTLLSLVAA